MLVQVHGIYYLSYLVLTMFHHERADPSNWYTEKVTCLLSGYFNASNMLTIASNQFSAISGFGPPINLGGANFGIFPRRYPPPLLNPYVKG